jgi:pyruvate dehydrogenase E2 component (dihydrolipoamide acetyltransferase)
MGEFRMPSLGADMEAGTLVEWMKKPGEAVQRGDIIAAVETAKGVIEVEVFEDGIIDQVFFQPGQEVPVGQVLATICTPEEYAVPKPAQKISPHAAPLEEVIKPDGPKAPPAAAPPEPAGPQTKPRRQRISPLARKLAADFGLDVNLIQGTGPAGAIQKADIEAFVRERKAAPPPAPVVVATTPPPPAPEVKPARVEAPPMAAPSPVPEPQLESRKPADFQTAMRQAIAAAMSRANRDIPHYYLETRIDMTKALRWLEEENQKRSIKERLLPVVVMLKAVAKALIEVPELNGFWIDGAHQISESIHIGFAIALRQGGLITPAIHDCDLKTFDELREAVNDLIIRTRGNRLRSSELTDATITVTSLGDRGVEKVYGVIYPPQVALVGLGKIIDQPWAENGMLGIRPVLVATLAGDHRATDGHRGGIFLEALNRNLQEVDKL